MKKNRQGGFSLVEVLVYIAVLVVLAGAIITSIFALTDSFNRNRFERELTDTAVVTLERIARAARDSASINLGSSQLNSDNGAVTFVDGVTTTEFYLEDGRVQVEVNNELEGPVTPAHITVNQLRFNRLVASSTKAIRVTLTLSVTEDVASTTMSFHTTAVLRNSYE